VATLYDAIRNLEEDLRVVRSDAKWAREDFKDAPKDRQLRVALDNLEYRASELGRKIAEYTFIAKIDEWHADVSRGHVVPDPLLMKLMPDDDDLLAAVHLSREGVKVPKSWRSSISGETVNDNQYDRDPRATSAA
jgi:hypothetical protein